MMELLFFVLLSVLRADCLVLALLYGNCPLVCFYELASEVNSANFHVYNKLKNFPPEFHHKSNCFHLEHVYWIRVDFILYIFI